MRVLITYTQWKRRIIIASPFQLVPGRRAKAGTNEEPLDQIRSTKHNLKASSVCCCLLAAVMTSYGKAETQKLIGNLESQLDRLVEQLQDLENCRSDLDAEEYEETKQETMEQLKELNCSLSKLLKGDISLVSSLGAMQLAMQAAISQAFKTPEVIRLFARREPNQLRERLVAIEQDLKLNRTCGESSDRQKAEILVALRQLGEQLSTEELQFLEKHNDISNTFKNIEFIEVNE